MYAPKFRSWMTDWERFDEALSYRLDAMEAEAKAEIRAMVEKAMPPKKKDPPPPMVWYAGGGASGGAGCAGWDGYSPSYGTNGMDQYINQRGDLFSAQQQMAAAQNAYPSSAYSSGGLSSLGNIFRGL